MLFKSITLATLCLTLAGLPSCSRSDRQPPERGAIGQDLRVTRDSYSAQHILTGELAAEHAVEITAPDVGVRPLEIRWLVENGTPVDAGGPLFHFDNSQLAQSLEDRQVAVTQALTDLVSTRSSSGSGIAEAQFVLEQARAELEKARIDAAIPPDLKSDAEYQELKMALERATIQASGAERELAAKQGASDAEIEIRVLALLRSRSELRQAESGIASLGLMAPRAGVALLGRSSREGRLWEESDLVWPGERLARLPDLETMIVRARLFDVDDGLIQPGLQAVVTLDAYPEIEYAGSIRQIDQRAFQRERDSTTRVFWVTVALETLDPSKMRPGMSVKVVIERPLPAESDGANLLIVPRESIRWEEGRARVLLANGSWESVEILDCGPRFCVVPAGLEPGTELGRVGIEGPSGP